MPVRRLLPALLCLAALAACSDDTGDAPADAGTSDTDGSGDTAPVTDAGDVTDEEVELPPACPEGEIRCSLDGSETVEVCSAEGVWVPEPCGPGEICFQGECGLPETCEPQRVDACLGCDRYSGCNEVGTAEGEFDVPFNLTCIEEDGVPTLIPRVCLPTEARCIDNRRLEACDECGLGYEFATDCFEDDESTVCDVDRCVSLCEFVAKTKTYIGCEYWGADLDNAFLDRGAGRPPLDADGQPYAIVVSNPNLDPPLTATVTVSMHDGLVTTRTVEPGALEVMEMHFRAAPNDPGVALSNIQGTMIGYEGFRVESDVPIVAYQFNPLSNETEVFSNDASLLFPTSSLGTEYLVMSRRQTFDVLKTYLTIVAVREGLTEVTIELPEYTLENPLVTLRGTNVESGASIPRLRGGETYTVQLDQYQVLNIETDNPGADLTGTRVTSNRPVVVFGGSEASNAPETDSCVYRASFDDWVCEATRLSSSPRNCQDAEGNPTIELCTDYITCCADHLEHQMLPMFAWGTSYNATRSAQRGDEADVWRVMSGRDGTTVTLVGLPDTWPLPGLIPRLSDRERTLDEGEWFDFQSPIDFEIVATGPVMVGQFLAAEQAPYPDSVGASQPPHVDAGTGDPAFILGVPVEQYRTDYTFLAPNAFELDYVTITAPVGAVVTLDGEVVPDEEWETFGRGEYHAARLLIEDGVHTVNSDLPVGVMVHGYDSYVSYGYPAGLDVREIFGRD